MMPCRCNDDRLGPVKPGERIVAGIRGIGRMEVAVRAAI